MKSDFTVLLVRIENTSEAGSTIKFLETNYETVMAENINSSVPVQLLTVSARSTVNDSLMYSILNPNNYFTIGATSGIISWTGTAIDREKISAVQLIIQV